MLTSTASRARPPRDLASSHGGVDTPGRRLRSPYRGEAVFRLPLAAGVFGTLAVNSLNMQADASSHGIGGARAAAIAPLLVSAAKGGSGLDSGFVIPGGITLDAAALAASISTSVSCRRRVAKL